VIGFDTTDNLGGQGRRHLPKWQPIIVARTEFCIHCEPFSGTFHDEVLKADLLHFILDVPGAHQASPMDKCGR